MRFRVDFSRLARSDEELQLSVEDSAFFKSSGVGNFLEILEIAEGHILDSISLAARENITAQELHNEYIKPLYPEAILISFEKKEKKCKTKSKQQP